MQVTCMPFGKNCKNATPMCPINEEKRISVEGLLLGPQKYGSEWLTD
jgi:hypothetical protein